MKIIISHDVDHASIHEHWLRDLFIWKYLSKTVFYIITGSLSFRVGLKRLGAIFFRRFHNIHEVMALDRQLGVPSTFFVGMRNGLGMSYPLHVAKQLVAHIQQEGFAVGVHGVAFDDARLISEEHERFAALARENRPFGARNHYLRCCAQTLEFQKTAGYSYDSTEYGMKPPYEVGGMIEFPVCLMDSYLLKETRNDLEEVKRNTLAGLAEGERMNLSYFTIIFHDVYFSERFPDHQAWYRWLVHYLKDHYEWSDFEHAVTELKAS